MRRLHLFEIEDQPWCPRVVRDGVTDFLEFMIVAGRAYDDAAPIISRLLSATGARRVIDLCSGGGGPWIALQPKLLGGGGGVPVHLTDLHPNVRAFEKAERASGGAITGDRQPVDATRVPATLDGVRTIFSGFHHFAPSDAEAVLRDAVRRRSPIAVFEATHRSAASIVATALSPLIVLVVTPFIRPLSLGRLLFTYLVPLIPLVALFDGIVSSLRTYTPGELLTIAGRAGGDYEWEAAEIGGRGPIPRTYLIGWPRSADASIPTAAAR